MDIQRWVFIHYTFTVHPWVKPKGWISLPQPIYETFFEYIPQVAQMSPGQLASKGFVIPQKLNCLSLVLVTQVAYKEGLQLSKSRICLPTAALFQGMIYFMPSPPSVFGLHTLSHATTPLFPPAADPFQRKFLQFLSISYTTSFGRIKTLHQ